MKTTIASAIIALLTTITIASCENGNKEMVSQVEKNKIELQKLDSILSNCESLVSSFESVDTTKAETKQIVQVLVMIKNKKTRENLDLLVSKNNDLLNSVNEGKISNEDAQKEITNINQSYSALLIEINEISKSTSELNASLITSNDTIVGSADKK